MHFFRNPLRLGVILASALAASAFAHDPGLSGLAVTVEDSRVAVVATFSGSDIRSLVGTAPTGTQLRALAPEVVTVTQQSQPLRPANVEVDPHAENNDIEFRLTYSLEGRPGPLLLRSTLLPRLSPGHRQYLSVRDSAGQLQAERLFRVDADSFEIAAASAGPSVATPPTFAGFLGMGIEHILTGYDHLLFLCALLLVARTFGASLKIVTCFTLGHSITLALATLDVVNLPSRIVEPLIAASIIYVGAENLLRRGAPHGRYLLTFAFGLVHGLGFAAVLREMGVGANGGGVALPLLGFNLGVELGQLGVAVVVLPIFWAFRKNPAWIRVGVPACSAVVVLAGACWFIERVAGLGG